MPPVTRQQTVESTKAMETPSVGSIKNESNKDDTSYLNHRRESHSSGGSKKGIYCTNPDEQSEAIPIYTIDLSLKPEDRYVELAKDFLPEIANLTALFDELVVSAELPFSTKTIHRVTRLLLRRVHDREQFRELRGISKVTGVEMYLLVALNVLLDLFMSCTSGGAKIRDGDEATKMVHFRTLDWGMDALRKVVVHLEFVQKPGGPVIARSVTYVGFVGILTAVRQDLSVSLNFRGQQNSYSKMSNIKHIYHVLCVLFGFRRSIASTLRRMMIPPTRSKWGFWKRAWKPPSYFELLGSIPKLRSTSCYLIISNGDETSVIEKDRVTGLRYASNTFIAATNSDRLIDGTPDAAKDAAAAVPDVTGMKDVLEESNHRRNKLEKRYTRLVKQIRRNNREIRNNEQVCLEQYDVEHLVRTYPITNECTHFAVIMDPKANDISWGRVWKDTPNTALLRAS